MRNKSLFLLIACVCGTVAAIGVGQWMQAQNGKGVIETVEIFVTAQTIGAQEEITADKIRLEQWPADRVPQGSTSDLKELEGRYAKQMFLAGEPVMPAKLMNDKDDVIVPKGFRVVSMKADQNSGIANLVNQGDRVDVDAYFTKSDLFPETKNMTILTGVKVFAIDGKTRRDEDDKRMKSARTISLLIRKADHEAWVLAQKNGEISLSLGSPGDVQDKAPEGEASSQAKEFLTWMEDHRAEQRRLAAEARARAAAERETEVEAGVVTTGKRKGVFRTTKLEAGRMIVYEWTPGNPVPTIVADTGPGETTVDTDIDSLDPVDKPQGADDFDHLNGPESPFFQPGE
ncbi:MAG: Flp pilus assembly protein CpaB [Pirellulaceae bacterium]|nr:Flp pilus assembly protein CpaB [Pirellulaceae bacterium]